MSQSALLRKMFLKSNPDRGFTLIELLVVMVLISLVTAFTIPSIRTSLFTDQLKATARHLVGLVVEVSQDAVSKQSEYFLNFDLDKNQVWATQGAIPKEISDKDTEKVTQKKLLVPESVKIVDIESFHGGKETQGSTKLYFSKKGYIDKTAIHLRDDDGRDMTIILSPFMGVTKIFDSYVDLDADRVRY